MSTRRKKKKLLRNVICIAYCSIQLLVALLLFRGIGIWLGFLDKKDVQAVHSEGIIFGEDEENENNLLFTVCLDAGHGGKDIGSDNGGRIEKDDNLKLTKAVAEYMSGQNIKVVLTREDDTFLSLEERCNVANDNEVDYFISLHRNKGDGNGVETWIRSDADAGAVELAESIMKKLTEAGIQRNRGVKRGTQSSESDKDYYINSHANMPSCIVELGFLNNTVDNQQFDEKLTDYAKAIGDAVIEVWENREEDAADSETPSGSEHAASEILSPAGTSEAGPNVGHTESWPAIENVASLDGTTIDWGQGNNMDEKNRPGGAITAQNTYGDYQAYFIADLDEDSHRIFLTIDEGYEYGFSGSILDTLKDKGVKAVFFVTEPFAKAQPELVRRMIDEGHTLGNHSVTHPSNGLPSQTLEQQQNEVMELHAYIKENFGYEMHLFRFPAGKFSEQSLAIVHNCGYKSVFWSFAYLDYDVNNQPDRLESLKKMVDKLHPGAIYLLHGESETNAEVLGEFIDRTRAAGYEFEVFD